MHSKKNITAVALLAGTLLLLGGCSGPRISLFPGGGDPLEETVLDGDAKGKVLAIQINGLISDMPQKKLVGSRPSLVQEVVSQLRKAEKDSEIKALILKVNSPGGTVTASDILYHELVEFKKKTGAVIVSAMMDVAASGAYYISLPADFIMAHPTAVTGSVGVIARIPKFTGMMEKIGVSVDVAKSGDKKDMLSFSRESAPEEKEILQSVIDGMADRFFGLVRKHRNISDAAFEKTAGGRIFTAEEAKALGLVDDIGYLSDATAKAKTLAGLSEGAKLVVYRRSDFPDDNLYNPAVSAYVNSPALIDIGLTDVLNPLSAGFYYLWTPAAGLN